MKGKCAALLLLLCLLLAGCGGGNPAPSGTPVKLEYAKLLMIEQHQGYRLVTITDPWKEGAVLCRYALVNRQDGNIAAPDLWEKPARLPEGTIIIHVPLKRLCVSTSVHSALLGRLGAADCISSICEGKYIHDSIIRQRLDHGIIKDVGSGLNPSVEKIVQLQTDGLLMSPFEGASYGLLEKTGIPIIECADYMERSALGRAEWIKFYGMLVGKDLEAEQIFSDIASNYNRLKGMAATRENHPKLIADMMSGNTWFMPGGSSTYGSLYKDAGADFSVVDADVNGTQPLSPEKVLLKAVDADVWIIKYNRPEDYDYVSLSNENHIYEQFAAFKNHHIYGCNTTDVPFYDEAPFRPDLLLGDIISLLYPDLLPSWKRRFYKPLAIN